MASKKINATKVKADVPQVPCWEDLDDSSLVAEDLRAEGFKDGLYAASLILEGVLQDARNDLENADLEPSADTAVRLTLENVARAFQREKGAM